LFSFFENKVLKVKHGGFAMVQELLMALSTLLSSTVLWEHQKEAVQKLIDLIARGGMRGLIKHPTCAGKTTLFCSIAKEVRLPTLILVPRSGLLDQVYTTLRKVGVPEKDIISSGKFVGTVEQMLTTHGDTRIVLMTYQGLLALRRANMGLYKSFHDRIQLLIADEGHTALGAKTKDAVQGTMMEEIREEQESPTDSFEELLELHEILEDFSCLELFVTATPVLLNKTVQDVYGIPVIDYLRYGDLVKAGVLIVPQVKSPGKAVLALDEEGIPSSQAGLDKVSHRFRMENGCTVYEAVLTHYLEEYDKAHGYFPGVVFCKDIASAEEFIRYALTVRPSLRLVRCTGGNEEYAPGVSLEKAKVFIEEEKGDLVVTVNKAGLGWDVPTLRTALVTVPFLSSARYLQGPVGRIGRALNDNRFPEKIRENTIIIEPEWYYERILIPESTGSGGDNILRSANVVDSKRIAMFQGFVHLFALGELSDTDMRGYFGENVFDHLPTALWTVEDWKVHLRPQLTVDVLLNMTHDDAKRWKDQTYGFGLIAAYRNVAGQGSPIAVRINRLHFGIILHGDDPGLFWALKEEEQKLSKQVNIPNFTAEEWKKHFELQLTAEILLEMSAREAVLWKDQTYGFGLIAAYSNVAGQGKPMSARIDRLRLGIILHGDDPKLLTELKKEELKEKVNIPNFTVEEWKKHLQPQLSVDNLLNMTSDDTRRWKDQTYAFGLVAAYRHVGGNGNPISARIDRFHLGIILHGDDPKLIAAWEEEKSKNEQKRNIPNLTVEEWKSHLKSQFTVDFLLKLSGKKAGSWKDYMYGFGLIAAYSKVGGYGDPTKYRVDRLGLGILLHGEDPRLLVPLKIEEQKEHDSNFTIEEWKIYLQTQLTVDTLLKMSTSNAHKWKDKLYKFGLKEAWRKVGFEGYSTNNRINRLRFGIVLHGENKELLAALIAEGWTRDEWKKHFELQLTVEILLAMSLKEALLWKDQTYGFGLTAANGKVGGSGKPISTRIDRLRLGLLIHGDDPRLLTAIEKLSK